MRLVVAVFAVAFAADFATKEWVVSVGGDVLYHDTSSRLPLRVLMSLAAVAVAYGVARLAAARGLGRQWGLWVGCALLVSGTLANGVSALLWAHGIPDFIHMPGDWVWNLADFEIAVGLSGGLLSVALSAAVAYTATATAARRHEG